MYSFCDISKGSCAGNKGEIISLNKKNSIIYDEFKKKTKVGHYPPMRLMYYMVPKKKKIPTKKKEKKRLEVLEEQEEEGYSFKASVQDSEIIEEDTFICEYSGNVNVGFSQVFS